MYYTKVKQKDCIACGLCQICAPQLFEYDDNGIAYTKQDNNQGITPIPKEELVNFKKAYTHCPTGAIIRSEKPFK